MKAQNRLSNFLTGMRHSIPVAAGYFAVAFSLGIAARNAGLTAFQATLSSMLLNASAGEYALFSLIAAGASLAEMTLMELVANARYLLMSCALSQKFSSSVGTGSRMVVGIAVTDELFGLAVSRISPLSPWYYFGMMACALPGWAAGTCIGVILGNILPASLVSALSVALYGMFLAIVIPPCKKSRTLLCLLLISAALSFVCSVWPLLDVLSSGTKTILLTVLISAVAAVLFPVKEEKGHEN